MFLRSVLALALLGAILVSQPADAETSDDFNSLNLYFYGDLDTGDGNISTSKPTSDNDDQSDCPQESNQRSWIGDDRQWGDVGSWYADLETPGAIGLGTYTFSIWANATQGDVNEVQFRVSIYVCNPDVPCNQIIDDATSNQDGVDSEDEQATEFEIEIDLSEDTQFQEDAQLRIDLEYSGGDEGSEPIIGGESTDQIVVLTSSREHPAGIDNITISHYRTDFSQITVEEYDERVFVKTQTWSAFGESDIDSSVWTLGVYGESSGNEGMTADINTKSNKNGSYEVTFYWYYNKANAISDTYHFYLEAIDIQGNTWQITSNEDLYLVIHDYEVDNVISDSDIQVNNQTGTNTVKAGNSFTLDITISAQGDPLIKYNPIPVSIIWVSGSTEIVLHDTVVFATPGATTSTSFRYTFDEKGEYQIRVVLDRGNLIQESNEANNIAQFTLIVSEPEKEDFIQSLVDGVTEGGAATVFVLVAAVTIIAAAFFLRRGDSPDLEWEDDDEF